MTTVPPELVWRCRRGTRELDLLLSRYLEQAYAAAPSDEQARFVALLERRDSELQALFFGGANRDESLGDLPARILALASLSA